jgi:aminopeptidase N
VNPAKAADRFATSLAIVGMVAATAMPAAAGAAERIQGLTAQTRKMGGPMPAEQLGLSFEHLDLGIKVFPHQKRIEARATLTLRAESPVSSLLLDLYPDFHVTDVRLNGKSLGPGSWSNPDGQLRIRMPQPLAAGEAIEAEIAYAGFPHVAVRPPWEGGMIWSRTEDGTPWIGSSLWGAGCDLLWPCIDHPTRKPATADLHISVPAPLVAPANGILTGMEEADGWRTYHWRARSPHTYGVVLNVGPFEVIEGEYESRFGNSIPLRFWHLPENRENAQELFREFSSILEFFESAIGPYPWADEKMGVVELPYKGMEHQTINAYGNNYEKSAYGFDSLLQHEFSHEYFANQMSVANYDDLWLHEGFGSYMQPLYGEYLHGIVDYFAMLKSTRAGIRNEQPLVTGRERSEKEVYADEGGPRGDIYSKGSLVLHTLRNLIGDDAFFEAVRILVYGRPDPRPGNFVPQFRTTEDFMEIVDRVTGDDLSWFFDVYLFQARLPSLEQTRDGGKVAVAWKVPENLPFPMPLEVLVGDKTIVLPMSGKRGEFDHAAGARITFDPRSKILRQSDAIDSLQEWRAGRKAADD